VDQEFDSKWRWRVADSIECKFSENEPAQVLHDEILGRNDEIHRCSRGLQSRGVDVSDVGLLIDGRKKVAIISFRFEDVLAPAWVSLPAVCIKDRLSQSI
jgi:hypothetical protein